MSSANTCALLSGLTWSNCNIWCPIALLLPTNSITSPVPSISRSPVNLSTLLMFIQLSHYKNKSTSCQVLNQICLPSCRESVSPMLSIARSLVHLLTLLKINQIVSMRNTSWLLLITYLQCLVFKPSLQSKFTCPLARRIWWYPPRVDCYMLSIGVPLLLLRHLAKLLNHSAPATRSKSICWCRLIRTYPRRHLQCICSMNT